MSDTSTPTDTPDRTIIQMALDLAASQETDFRGLLLTLIRQEHGRIFGPSRNAEPVSHPEESAEDAHNVLQQLGDLLELLQHAQRLGFALPETLPDKPHEPGGIFFLSREKFLLAAEIAAADTTSTTDLIERLLEESALNL